MVFVDLIKRERPPRRVAEDQTGASGPRSVTAGRWRNLDGSLVGQDSMGSFKVSGALLQLGQVVLLSLCHDR